MAGGGVHRPRPGNNTATDVDTNGPQAIDLAVTKDDGQTSYVPGLPIAYTLVVTNAGPSTATGFLLTDEVPEAIAGVTVTCTATGTSSCGTRTRIGRRVATTNPTLNPGDTLTITIRGIVAPDTTGDLVNTAEITAGAGSAEADTTNNSATDTDTQGTSQVDLAVVKTDSQATYVPGKSIDYTITVTNAGPTTATGFSIADSVPSAITGTTVTCVVTGTGSCGTDSSSGNAIAFANASLAPGTDNQLTLTVTGTVSPSAAGALANTVSVTPGAAAADTDPSNNTATDTDGAGAAQVDLSITKIGSQPSFVPGTPVRYTMAVANAGPSVATGFSIADLVPPEVSGVTATCAVIGSGSCGTNASSGNSVSFVGGSLVPGGGNTLTLTVTGNLNPSVTGSLVNTATVIAGGGSLQLNPVDNSSTSTVPLTPLADLQAAKNGPASATAA